MTRGKARGEKREDWEEIPFMHAGHQHKEAEHQEKGSENGSSPTWLAVKLPHDKGGEDEERDNTPCLIAQAPWGTVSGFQKPSSAQKL